jgi:Tfp pilus assembly protein PilF
MRPIVRWAGTILLAACTWFGGALANPYTPIADSVVLQRLPEKLDPTLAELKRMRAALRVDPANLATAARVAQRSIEAARATGDPRFLGQAQAALSPWWNAVDPPVTALLLRATVKQSQHDFQGALADLDRVLAKRPADGQALLTRATIATVQGRYADAVRDCAKLSRVASGLVATVCMAGASSLNGNAAGAYHSLAQELDRPGESANVRAWALTLAAEIAARRGDAGAADLHFHSALMLDPRDAYLLGAYADFLLEQGRTREVLSLLADCTASDPLLLRVALAEKALREGAVDLPAHQRELADRFAAAKRRGDTLHLREEARFRLEIESDTAVALALATANWKVQREPADLRILAAAAQASGDAAAMSAVSQWVATTRIEDVALVALDGALARGPAR